MRTKLLGNNRAMKMSRRNSDSIFRVSRSDAGALKRFGNALVIYYPRHPLSAKIKGAATRATHYPREIHDLSAVARLESTNRRLAAIISACSRFLPSPPFSLSLSLSLSLSFARSRPLSSSLAGRYSPAIKGAKCSDTCPRPRFVSGVIGIKSLDNVKLSV